MAGMALPCQVSAAHGRAYARTCRSPLADLRSRTSQSPTIDPRTCTLRDEQRAVQGSGRRCELPLSPPATTHFRGRGGRSRRVSRENAGCAFRSGQRQQEGRSRTADAFLETETLTDPDRLAGTIAHRHVHRTRAVMKGILKVALSILSISETLMTWSPLRNGSVDLLPTISTVSCTVRASCTDSPDYRTESTRGARSIRRAVSRSIPREFPRQ